MNFIRGNLFILAFILLFSGCVSQQQKPSKVCPGKQTPQEAIDALNANCKSIQPIRASGQCLLKYFADDKEHKENFPVKIWTNPPGEVYLQGDVAFDATGMVFGSNSNEFWFWLKPKEISSYWWGKWSKAGQWEGFLLSPQILLEAFGSVDFKAGDWSLTHGKYDILWLHDSHARLVKRIYIDTCDYFIVKIEYLDNDEQIKVSAEFQNYKKLSDGFFVPTLLKIYFPSSNGPQNSTDISLNAANLVQLNQQQRTRLFQRPLPQGFKHFYQIINGRAFEENGQ